MSGRRGCAILIALLVVAPLGLVRLVAADDDGMELVASWPRQPRPSDVERGNIGSIAFLGSEGAVVFAAGNQVFCKTSLDEPSVCIRPLGTPASAIACSPDSQRIVVATASVSTLSVYDIASGRRVKLLPAFERVSFLAWSPSGDRVIAASPVGDLAIASITTAGQIWRSPGAGGSVYAAGFTSSGPYVGVLVSGNKFEIRDAETGAVLHKLDLSECAYSPLAFSADGTKVAVVHGEFVEVQTLATGALVWRAKFRERPTALAVSCDGTRICAAGDERRLTFYGRDTGLDQPLPRHTGAVRSIAFSPDALRVLSAGADGLVHLWGTKKGAHLTRVECAPARGPVVYAADGASALVGTEDGVSIVDPEAGSVIRDLKGPPATRALAFRRGGAEVVAIASGSVVSWPATGGEPVSTPCPGAVAFLGSRSVVVLRDTEDGKSRFFVRDLLDGSERAAAETTGNRVLSVRFTPDARLALVATPELELWDTGKLRRVWRYENCPPVEGAVGISSDGVWGAAMHSDRKLRLWLLAKPWAQAMLSVWGVGVPSVIEFEPGGKWLLVGTTDGRFHKVLLPASPGGRRGWR